MRRIGILGGTFDPPHIGHLIISEEVRLSLELEEIWFIPTYLPPHKNEPGTFVNHRINMLEKALSTNPYFYINRIEIERLGKSYTFDTMRVLKEEHPDAEFYFIIGADMVEYLPNWHRVHELIHMVQFVGVNRKGYHLDSDYPIIETDIPLIEVSSTMLRKRLKNNQSVKYIVPEEVYTYIKENKLYEQG